MRDSFTLKCTECGEENYITSKNKKSNLPTHVKLTSHILERNSMVLLEQLKTVDKSRICAAENW